MKFLIILCISVFSYLSGCCQCYHPYDSVSTKLQLNSIEGDFNYEFYTKYRLTESCDDSITKMHVFDERRYIQKSGKVLAILNLTGKTTIAYLLDFYAFDSVGFHYYHFYWWGFPQKMPNGNFEHKKLIKIHPTRNIVLIYGTDVNTCDTFY